MITARLAGVSKMPKEYYSETPPTPKSFKIEISSRCNYRCAYCALSNRGAGTVTDIDFDLFKRITKEAIDFGVTEIGLFYIGESFTNPDLLIRCIEYVKSIGAPYIFLTTNGSLASPDKVEECMKAGLDSLKFSCNFADVEQFMQYSGVKNPAVFQQATDNIKAARVIRDTGGYATKLYSSSIMYELEQEMRMKPYYEAHIKPYVDEHYWLPLFNETAMAHEKMSIGNVGNYHDPADPLPCWTVFTAMHIMADGRVSACCHDAIGHWLMGDLTTQSVEEVWNSTEYRELRRAHLAKEVTGTKCKDCIDSTLQIGH
jgi:radical SAM protein with 4Fe4S-binding SPASM domain